MDNKEAIEHLDRVAQLIGEAIWLIDISSEEIRSSELTNTFKARISEMLIEHLKSAIEDIQYAQYLVKDLGDANTRDYHHNPLADEFGIWRSKAQSPTPNT